MKRLGVLGTLVWDRIWRSPESGRDAKPLEEWGGLAYSLAAAAAVCPPGWEIVPLLKVGSDLAESAHGFLRSLPTLRVDAGVRMVAEPNNRVELRYLDAARRCERLTGAVPPWTAAELLPLVAEVDALYINFISGFELALPEAMRLRQHFAGPIYADLHSLFLAWGPSGDRSLQPLPDAREWLRCFDAVQLNEDEMAMLAGPDADRAACATNLLGEGVVLVVTTLGERGAAFVASADLPADPIGWPVFRRSCPRTPAPIHSRTVPAPGSPIQGDPTGCGDVFGGTLFAKLLGGASLEDAAADAAAAAARNVSHSGASGLWEHLSEAVSAAKPPTDIMPLGSS